MQVAGVGQRLVVQDNQDGREEVTHPLGVAIVEVSPHERADDVAHLVQVLLTLEVPLGRKGGKRVTQIYCSLV